MFGKTKCDLSAGITTLDLDALKFTADVAQGKLVQEIRGYTEAMLRRDGKHSFTLETLWVADAAYKLQIVSEVQAALYGMDQREAVKWVNHNPPTCPDCGFVVCECEPI